MDDDNGTGEVSMEGIQESFEIMEIELESNVMEFIFYWMYKDSTDINHLKYKALFDILEEEIIEEDGDFEENESSQKVQEQSQKTESYAEDYDKLEESEKVDAEVEKSPSIKTESENDPIEQARKSLKDEVPQTQSLEPGAQHSNDLVQDSQSPPEEIDEE